MTRAGGFDQLARKLLGLLLVVSLTGGLGCAKHKEADYVGTWLTPWRDLLNVDNIRNGVRGRNGIVLESGGTGKTVWIMDLTNADPGFVPRGKPLSAYQQNSVGQYVLEEERTWRVKGDHIVVPRPVPGVSDHYKLDSDGRSLEPAGAVVDGVRMPQFSHGPFIKQESQ